MEMTSGQILAQAQKNVVEFVKIHLGAGHLRGTNQRTLAG